MLPKSRIASALFVGLGLALIVAGLAAPKFLNGDARFPLDLENTTWTLQDPDGTVGEEKEDGKAVDAKVPLTRQLHMTVQNPANDEVAALRIGDSLRRGDKGSDFENLLTASTWSLQMDRKSGEFVAPAKLSTVMALPEAEVPIDGVWLKFPSSLEQQDYQVFDTTLRTSAPARFTGETEQYGRTLYTFEQEIPATNVASLYADAQNTLTVPAPGPDGGQQQVFRHHTAKREFTVDQITGLVVGMNEQVDDYYADRSGKRVRTIVSYDAEMDEGQTRALAEQLPAVTQRVSRGVTYTVMGLGALTALAGLAGAFRPPAPRHRQRGQLQRSMTESA